MPNVFLSLPFPPSEGVGAAVDTSGLGAERTITATGPFDASVTIEASGDGVIFSPIHTFNNPGKKLIPIAATQMRIRVENIKKIVSPSVEVSAEGVTTRSATLDVPAGNGTGAATDVSIFGRFTTFYIQEPYSGTVTIEESGNGVDFFACATFARSTTVAQQKSKMVTARFFRVVRAGINPRAVGLPIVEVAASDDMASGGFTDELVKTNGADTTAEFLEDKALSGDGVTVNVIDKGAGNLALQFDAENLDSDNIVTGIPITVRGDTNAAGAGPALALNDHDHRLELQVEDEGALEGARPTINFVGVGVTATDDVGNDRVDITIPGDSDGGANVTRKVFESDGISTDSVTFTDALAGSSILIPIDGDYCAMFHGEGMNQNANAELEIAIGVNSTIAASGSSEFRSQGNANDQRTTLATADLPGLTAGDTIHGIYRRSAGSGTQSVALERRRLIVWLVQ
jgi:hypothetical protein